MVIALSVCLSSDEVSLWQLFTLPALARMVSPSILFMFSYSFSPCDLPVHLFFPLVCAASVFVLPLSVYKSCSYVPSVHIHTHGFNSLSTVLLTCHSCLLPCNSTFILILRSSIPSCLYTTFIRPNHFFSINFISNWFNDILVKNFNLCLPLLTTCSSFPRFPPVCLVVPIPLTPHSPSLSFSHSSFPPAEIEKELSVMFFPDIHFRFHIFS